MTYRALRPPTHIDLTTHLVRFVVLHHGTQNAPKFNGKTLALLLCFLEDVDILGTAAGITDLEKIHAAIRYADLKEAEGWELLDEVTANPLDWANFAWAVKKLYPGCKGTN